MTGNNRTLLIISIILGVIICLLLIGIGFILAQDFILVNGTSEPVQTPTVQAPAGSTPNIMIIGAVSDVSVTFQAQNFPPNESIAVSMGESTQPDASKYYPAGTGITDAEGKFSGTYNIPQELKGESAIILYLQSETGYYAYTSFKN